MKVNDVIQFNENHDWCGSFGMITEVKDCKQNGIRYQVAVPIPLKGTAYIYVMDSEDVLEYIGEAKLIFIKEDE